MKHPFKTTVHHLCAVKSFLFVMCQRTEGRGQEKLCPLSPPAGHLTTVALSVHCHIPLAYPALHRPVCPLSKSKSFLHQIPRRFMAGKVFCAWAFAWTSPPCGRQGNNTRPTCLHLMLRLFIHKIFPAKRLEVENRQQDFVSKAELLHSKPYTVLEISLRSYPENLQNYRLKNLCSKKKKKKSPYIITRSLQNINWEQVTGVVFNCKIYYINMYRSHAGG